MDSIQKQAINDFTHRYSLKKPNISFSDKPGKKTVVFPGRDYNIEGIKKIDETEYAIREITVDKKEISAGFERLRFPCKIDLLVNTKGYKELAHFTYQGMRYPCILRLEKDEILYAFDPISEAYRVMTYGYFKKEDKVTGFMKNLKSWLGNFLPYSVRVHAIDCYVKATKFFSRDDGFPKWPIDTTADDLYQLAYESMKLAGGEGIREEVIWPRGYKYCFVTTHDVDTYWGFENIGNVCDVEDNVGLKSTWFIPKNFVSEKVAESEEVQNISQVKMIERRGFEVGSHDLTHDFSADTLTYAEYEERIKEYLNHFRGVKIKGFRPPYNNFVLKRTETLKKHFLYSSGLQNSRIFGSLERHRIGAATIMPHLINGIVELPVTVPSDFLLGTLLKYDPEKILETWLKQFETIKKRKGLILMQTHPCKYDLGNPKILKAYRKALETVRRDKSCWVATAWEVANWWNEKHIG
ncbi:MAG: hypothetical protein KKD39_05210 [Candidatus Altiarchaeota archaeon]|nr:hypothetical protein [Candidatus Altiarchaeota archaeon]